MGFRGSGLRAPGFRVYGLGFVCFGSRNGSQHYHLIVLESRMIYHKTPISLLKPLVYIEIVYGS